MKKPLDATFYPLSHILLEPTRLPSAVQQAAEEADSIQRRLAAYSEMFPRRGPAPTLSAPKPLVGFIADSPSRLDRLIGIHRAAIGKRARGNKRIGRMALYADLVSYFVLLQRHGVRLPRNKSLSVKACLYGLGEILRRYGCTDFTDQQLIKDSRKRQAVADNMDRIFSHIANIVENTPA